ncbi:MAG: hypothetical protein FWG77_10040 [Treponema sp.]|nr:hypothetical protein [Treponema sp.]
MNKNINKRGKETLKMLPGLPKPVIYVPVREESRLFITIDSGNKPEESPTIARNNRAVMSMVKDFFAVFIVTEAGYQIFELLSTASQRPRR